MPRVRTNGIEADYEEYGAGPPIVFLHGGTMDLRLWAEQARPLADEYRIIVYEFWTDTFYIPDDTIEFQTYATKIIPKY